MTDIPLPPPPARGGEAGAGDEIRVAFAGPVSQNRLTVLVRYILALPHLIIVSALAVASEVVVIIAWFAALFTGGVPTGLADFMTGYLRWQTRTYAYLFLLTDRYPPFALGDVDYPVRLETRPGRLNRLTVFFRFFLAIPVALLASLLSWGSITIVAFVTWLIVLITGRMPAALHGAYAAAVRYQARVYGYMFLLTGRYPAGLFGDGPVLADPAWPAPEAPAGPAPGAPAWPVPPVPDPGGSWVPPPGPMASDAPGFGQPYPPAGAWEGEPPAASAPPQWRLALSSGAKGLVGLFLALGVLGVVAYIVLLAVLVSSTVNTAVARAQVQNAHAQLLGAMSTFETKVQACGNNLTCVTGEDSQAAAAIGAFGAQLRATSFPSSAAAQASQLESVTSQAQRSFRTLATATSIPAYQQAVAATGIQSVLNQFDADYQQLVTTLSK